MPYVRVVPLVSKQADGLVEQMLTMTTSCGAKPVPLTCTVSPSWSPSAGVTVTDGMSIGSPPPTKATPRPPDRS